MEYYTYSLLSLLSQQPHVFHFLFVCEPCALSPVVSGLYPDLTEFPSCHLIRGHLREQALLACHHQYARYLHATPSLYGPVQPYEYILLVVAWRHQVCHALLCRSFRSFFPLLCLAGIGHGGHGLLQATCHVGDERLGVLVLVADVDVEGEGAALYVDDPLVVVLPRRAVSVQGL